MTEITKSSLLSDDEISESLIEWMVRKVRDARSKNLWIGMIKEVKRRLIERTVK